MSAKNVAKKAASKAKPAKIGLSELESAYKVIVDYLQSNTSEYDNKNNLNGTPNLAAKSLMERAKSDLEISKELRQSLQNLQYIARDTGEADVVVHGPIELHSICPSHLMPTSYEAYVSYVPNPQDGYVVATPSLYQAVAALGRRAVIHAKLASDIVDVLCKPAKPNFPSIETAGAAALLLSTSPCVACNKEMSEVTSLTYVFRGVFKNKDMEAKFYQAINNIQTSRPKR